MSINDIGAKVKQLEKDMYYGNGKPGITIRIQQAEDCLEVHEEKMNTFEDRQKNIYRMFFAIVVLLLGAIVTASVDMAKHGTEHTMHTYEQ